MHTVTIVGNSGIEGTGSLNNGNRIELTARLDKPATAPVALDIYEVSGTALADYDFNILGLDTIRFDPGERTQTITISVLRDSVGEPDESFIIEGHVTTGNARFEDGSLVGRAVGFIQDDDFADNVITETVHVSSPFVVEGDGGSKTARFNVTLSRPSNDVLSMPWRTVEGSAEAGEDFVARSGTLTFLPGQTEATVDVPILGDGVAEPDETFGLEVDVLPLNPFGALLGQATIQDDDMPLPTVSLYGPRLIEGSSTNTDTSGFFVARLSEPATSPVTIGYQLRTGTGIDDTDGFVRFDSRTIDAGEQVALIPFVTIGDTVPEPDEFLVLQASVESANATFADGSPLGRAAAFVIDDDANAGRTLYVSQPVVVEGDGRDASAAFELSLSRPANAAFTLDYETVATGSAAPGSDYVATNGRIEWEVGQREASFSIPIIGDLVPEPDETFSVLFTPSIDLNGFVATGVTILDEDPAATEGADRLSFIGSDTAVTLDALGGDDVVIGSALADRLSGGRGNDTVEGRGGSDVLFGGDGADVMRGGGGADRMVGGIQSDRMIGNGGNDAMFGQDGRDDMFGGAGNDAMNGNQGADELFGGAGRDTLDGGGGSDVIAGGAGADILTGDVGRDALSGDAGVDRLFGGAGSDTLEGGDDVDRLFGEGGRDILDGGSGNDFVFGGGGSDLLRGGDGRDHLRGGGGNDDLRGGNGRDTLTGGEGNDVLRGQGEADRFAFGGDFGRDLIVDFNADLRGERIDLSGVATIVSFNDLTANHMTAVGASTVINARNGDVIVVRGVSPAEFDPSDFIFG